LCVILQGFSIGVTDVTPSQRLVQQKKTLISSGYERCAKIIQKFKEGKLELEAGCSEEQSLEAKCLKELSDLREAVCRVTLRLPKASSTFVHSFVYLCDRPVLNVCKSWIGCTTAR
jgi:DNA-directed RNA polymerase beta' subunit